MSIEPMTRRVFEGAFRQTVRSHQKVAAARQAVEEWVDRCDLMNISDKTLDLVPDLIEDLEKAADAYVENLLSLYARMRQEADCLRQ